MFVIGTVAGPRDTRLVDWAKHWRHRGQLLVIVQAGPDWMAGELAGQVYEAAPDIEIIPALPTGNADLHWNSLMAIAVQYKPEATITCKGTDEYMDENSWKNLKQIVRKDPGGAVFWVSYRDTFDGHSFKEMQQGPDYHPIVVRGMPLRYPTKFHTWPSPLCGPEHVRYLPETIFIEHRRSLVDVIRSNRQRETIASPQEIQVQNQFVAKLKQVCEQRGIEWPEEQPHE